VQDDLTALGLVSRLEYVLDRFEADLEEQTRRAADAGQRLAGYEPRLGEVFPLQAELDEKFARMAELEADLAKTESIVGEDTNSGASEPAVAA
jgi:predicted RNase H-like nuclease (RuvC/YqgF family)